MTKNSKSVFSNIGARNHQFNSKLFGDYYATDPIAISLLHKHDLLDKDQPYWETAVGGGALAIELKRLGYNVTKETDLFDRGYVDGGVNFFDCNEVFEGNTITNPPYEYITEWILHSLKVTSNKVYIFCRIQTIESITRYNKIFKNNPPSWICPFVKRVRIYRNGELTRETGAVCYGWFIWDNKDDSGETRVKWLI